MAKNLFFGFGARDNGLKDAISDLTSEFKSLGKEILGLSRFQTMLSAMSFDKLDQMADKLKTLGTAGMELTSGWESEFKANSVSMSKLGAQWGLTAAEAQQFAQKSFAMSKSIGMSTDTANQALIGMSWASEETKDSFKKLGIEGAEGLAKFATQLNMDPKDFAYEQSQMQKSLGLTSDQMALMTNEAIKLGQESGDFPNALKALTGMTEKLRSKKGFLMSQGLSAEEATKQVAKMSQETMALGKVFQAGGVLNGLESATGIFDKLNESSEGFAGLLSGAQGDLPQLVTDLAKTGMPVQQIFDSMQQGPLEFTKGIAQMVEGAGTDTEALSKVMMFFRKHAEGVFGSDVATQLADAFTDTNKRAAILGATIETNVKDAGKLSKEIVKGYQDPRTAMQIFQDQQAAFMQRFRAMGTMTTGAFLKETQASFTAFGNMMTKAATDPNKGFLSVVLNKMGDIQKFGAAGLFPPDMQGPLVALGSTAEGLISPLAKLRAAGINILSPFGLLAAAAAGLGAKFLSLKAAGKSTDEALEAIGASVLKFVVATLPSLAMKAAKAVADFIRNLFLPPKPSQLPKATAMANAIFFFLKKALVDAFNFTKELLVSLWKGLTGQMTATDVLTGSDAQAIGAGIGIKLVQAFDAAISYVKQYVNWWWGQMTAIWTDPSKSFGDKLKDSLLPSLPMLGAGALAFGPLVKILKIVFHVGGLVVTVVETMVSVIGGLGTVVGALWDILSGAVTLLVDFVSFITGTSTAVAGLIVGIAALTAGFMLFPQETQAAMDSVASFMGNLGQYVGIGIAYLAEAVASILPMIVAYFPKIMSAIFGFVVKMAPALQQALLSIVEVIKQFVSGAIIGIRDTLAAQFPAAAGPIFTVFNAIQSVWETIVGTLKVGIVFVTELVGTVAYFFERLWNTASLVFQVIAKVVTDFYNQTILPFITSAQGSFQNLWNSIYQLGKPVFDWLADIGKWFYDTFVTGITKVIDDIKNAFGQLKGVITSLFDGIDNWLKGFLGQKSATQQAATPPPAMPQPAAAAGAGATPPAPTTTPTPVMTPPALASTPVGAVATGPQLPASSLAAAPNLAGGIPALSAQGKPPKGLAQATTPSQSPNQIQQQLNQNLVSAINQPAWVGPYMQMLQQQHNALITALNNQKRVTAPAPAPAGTGLPAARKPKPIAAGAPPAKSTP